MDGLQLFFHKSLADEFGEDLQDPRFVLRLESKIRIFEIAEDTELLKLPALNFYVFARVFFAELTNFGFGQLFCLIAEFGNDFRFDGQAVAVPAGDVRASKPVIVL